MIKRWQVPKNDPAVKLIGFRLIKVVKGRAVCEMRARDNHQNPIGWIHGGILSYFADTAMGYAFLSQLPASQWGVAINLEISFLKPVHTGDFLRAQAKTLSHGRSIYFMECEIKNRAGALIAKASSTCKVLKPKRGK